jgi:NSS family neurotransmitter:Na+ symporter
MALYVTYGSYLAREHRIPGAAVAVMAGDTGIALLAGLAIFPAVFTYGLDPATGPELVFITLPQVFLAMPGGQIVGLLFFFLLAAAALSASISGIEVPTACVSQRLRLPRRTSASVVGLAAFFLGVPASLGYGLLSHVRWDGRGILESMDYIVSNSILPLGGFLTAIFVGWRWGRRNALTESDLGETILGTAWLWLLRIAAPAFIAVIFLRSIQAI